LVQNRAALIAAIRLVALPSLGVSRSRWLLGNAEPEEIIDHLVRGRLPGGLPDPRVRVTKAHIEKWRTGLRAQNVDDLVARNLNGPHRIIDAGSAEWPFALDPDPPVLVFVLGSVELLTTSRRVAVVGTRRCSAIGRSVAREIGWTLAEHDVSVVSGLAVGIDGAAHRGAGTSKSDPGRIGVVASGLDMTYPAANEDLWDSVARSGVLISETPMGERATRWRFPARNRLIAGISELVVVVESHERGGALLTVDEALGRNVDVVAVPGSVLSQSCRGTNQLLMDGIPPARNGEDLVAHLGLDPPETTAPNQQLELDRGQPSPVDTAQIPDPPNGTARLEDAVLVALESGPAGIDALAGATGIEISTLLSLIQRLKRSNRVEIDGSVVAKRLLEGE
jgi:DNA processing protein